MFGFRALTHQAFPTIILKDPNPSSFPRQPHMQSFETSATVGDNGEAQLAAALEEIGWVRLAG